MYEDLRNSASVDLGWKYNISAGTLGYSAKKKCHFKSDIFLVETKLILEILSLQLPFFTPLQIVFIFLSLFFLSV